MNPSLVDIKGIGEATAQMLVDAGFPSVEDVANADPAALTAVQGIGDVRASQLKAHAIRLVEEQVPAAAHDETPTTKLSKSARKKARELKKRAKDLQQQAKDLAKKAKSTKSKKKRKRRLIKVADLEAAAKKARKKAKKLLSG